VTVASVMPEQRLEVTCSRGVKLVADRAIKECAAAEWDLIVCPGGCVTETEQKGGGGGKG
jgi:protein deglycase